MIKKLQRAIYLEEKFKTEEIDSIKIYPTKEFANLNIISLYF